jgi:hypothetical protein
VNKIKLEHTLYFLAVLLAAVFRLTALSNLESNQAFQAVKLFEGAGSPISASPLYLGSTGVLFSIFGSSDIGARIIPAILGILFVLAPLLFKDKLGKSPAVILAFFLAIDPFLIYISREAGSGMLAIFSVIIFLGVFLQGFSVWTGVFGMLTLLSGPMAFPGIVAIGLSAIGVIGKTTDPKFDEEYQNRKSINWKTAIVSAGITLLIAGMLFIKVPYLVNGAGSSWIEALKGWVISLDTESQGIFSRIIISLLFLIPIATLLGITGMVRGFLAKNKISGFFTRWAIIALVIVLIYPAHQVTDLVWVSIPLWTSAAGEIHLWVHRPLEHKSVSYIFAAASSVLLMFCGSKIINLLVYEPGSADYQLAIAGIALTLLMLVVAAFLIGWGWSWKASFFGLGIGVMVVLTLFTLNMSRRAAGMGNAQTANILNPEPIPFESRLLKKTIDDISLQNSGVTGDLEIFFFKLRDPFLHWTFQDYSKTSFIDSFGKEEAPELVVTSGSDSLTLPVSYRGQDFVQSAEVPWSLLTIKEWMKWLFYGEAPLQKQYLILWVRNDLFPLGNPGTPGK